MNNYIEKPRYSDKELAMFRSISKDLEELALTQHSNISVHPHMLYREAVWFCFMHNVQGPAVDSLRRCMNAWLSGDVFRLTPEWDALIQLEE